MGETKRYYTKYVTVGKTTYTVNVTVIRPDPDDPKTIRATENFLDTCERIARELEQKKAREKEGLPTDAAPTAPHMI